MQAEKVSFLLISLYARLADHYHQRSLRGETTYTSMNQLCFFSKQNVVGDGGRTPVFVVEILPGAFLLIFEYEEEKTHCVLCSASRDCLYVRTRLRTFTSLSIIMRRISCARNYR